MLGVSVDDVATACRFAGERKVVLLQDPERRIASAYGVIAPLLSRIRRVTYVINASSVVRAVIHHELQFARHATDALALVRELARAGR